MKNPFTNSKGRLISDGKSVLNFIEDCLAFVLVILLTVLTISFKIIREDIGISINNTDNVIANLGLLFACIAGIITWRENKHLSLGSITEKLPAVIKNIFEGITSFVTPLILVQFFFTFFGQLFNSEAEFVKPVFWGIPGTLFYFFLPVCYLMMIIMVISQKKHKVVSIMGLCAGLFAAAISVNDFLFFAFKVSDVKFLTGLETWWRTVCSTSTLPVVLFLILLAFMGLPLFLVITGIIYVLYSGDGTAVSDLGIDILKKFESTDVIAIPLFTIAGYLLSKGSASERFVNLFKALFGWFRGGTVIASVFVLTFFSTFTGVSGVTILALGGLLSIILSGTGYNKDRAEGLITSSGALGLLFPPSVAIIMFISTNFDTIRTTLRLKNFDILDPFKGALIPGVLMAAAMIILGIVFDKNENRPKFSLKTIGHAFKDCIFELLLPVLICVTYFTNFFSLFEVASFAVIYTMLLTTVIRKDFNLRRLGREVADSVPVSGGVLFIIAAASCLSAYMTVKGIPETVTNFIAANVSNKYLFLFYMNIVLLIVGCLMDIYSATIILSPLLIYAADVNFGIPVVQTTVIFIMNLSIGFLTPPVGMDLFISSYAFNKPVSKVIKGVLPFLAVQLVVLMMVTYIPQLTTCLIPESHFEKAEEVSDQDALDDMIDFSNVDDDFLPEYNDDYSYESDYSETGTGETVIIDGIEYTF